MKSEKFEMVAKTFQGLEDVLAAELTRLGAENVTAGRRMVSFEGDNEMLYKANFCCRTALRILKPICKFTASDPDTLYDMVKEMDWSALLSVDKTFSIDPVVNSDTFTHSRYVTYRVKDAIVDYFQDRLGEGKRPGVRLQDADVMINVHIDGNRVTMSLDSSGESLHRRGYRVAQTEAPINEVLAAGILLKAGYDGQCPLIDPMCGSGTFLIEAAMIAANINPGVYRRNFAFEQWPDFDEELFERLYNDDTSERTPQFPIIGADISPKAIAIAEKNIKQAGVGRWIDLQIKPIAKWDEAPADGMLVTNPPYGERISVDDMASLYQTIGNRLKNVFKGYRAWIIGYQDEHMRHIGLAPSQKATLYNGSLECELREYEIFEGNYKNFRSEGKHLDKQDATPKADRTARRKTDDEWRRDARKQGFGGRNGDTPRFRKDGDRGPRKPNALEEKYRAKPLGRKKRFDDEEPAPRGFGRKPSFGGKSFGGRHDDGKPFGRHDEGRPFGRRNDKKPFTRNGNDAPESENPLAKRRNQAWLDEIMNRESQPKPLVRRGWRRAKGNDSTDAPASDEK
ncbi:THUMP domain-containing protein [uncultured Muribaculum sp.]|uniref:THUMP domain-containing class I SAM-dependent RNA methyltransferase n=1 Tax=uncultured Muribaculum sp. TaxID=1918613 RepID=UPI0025D5C7DF|nr:THUMP domain-containing protein [uncultured Muribaculum sp.]